MLQRKINKEVEPTKSESENSSPKAKITRKIDLEKPEPVNIEKPLIFTVQQQVLEDSDMVIPKKEEDGMVLKMVIMEEDGGV